MLIDKINNYIKEYELTTNSIDVRRKLDGEEVSKFSENYNLFRSAYNKSNDRDIVMLYTLTFYSFSNLIRFNSKDEFNMPVGKQYFTKEDCKLIENWYNRLSNRGVQIINGSAFDLFENAKFNEFDFVYCDPPYTNTTAIYNESQAYGGWSIEDDTKLFENLTKLNDEGIKWGLSNVFSNKDRTNDHLIKWCEENGWNIEHLNYSYYSLGKGNAQSDEVYISNYKPNIIKQIKNKLF